MGRLPARTRTAWATCVLTLFPSPHTKSALHHLGIQYGEGGQQVNADENRWLT